MGRKDYAFDVNIGKPLGRLRCSSKRIFRVFFRMRKKFAHNLILIQNRLKEEFIFPPQKKEAGKKLPGFVI